MNRLVFSAFADELSKQAESAGGSSALRALDRAGNLVGSGTNTLARNVPRLGTFGVKTFAKAASDSPSSYDVGVANAEMKTTSEDDRSPGPPTRIARRKVAEKSRDAQGREYDAMNREKWIQTAKDVPIVILGTGLGYGLGKTVAEEVGKRLALSGQKPEWLKYAPPAMAAISSLSSYALGRSRAEMQKRREQASKPSER
jgi:hypothetical protein